MSLAALIGSSQQLPGSDLIQWDFSSSLAQFANVAAVLAGFSITLIGLLAIRGRESEAASRQNALAVLLPGVLSLILSAYFYSEAAGSTDDATTVLVALGAAAALAVGALATFLAFSLLVGHQSDTLHVATRWTFWLVAAVATLGVALGQWTLDEALFNRNFSLVLGLQFALLLAGFVGACFAARWVPPHPTTLVKVSVIVLGAICLVAFSAMLLLDDRSHATNVASARELAPWWGTFRTATWVVALVTAAFALPRRATDKQRPFNRPLS